MSLTSKIKLSLVVGAAISALSANPAAAALPSTGKCAMLATVVKPYWLPAWTGNVAALVQQQPLNFLAIVDFGAHTVSINGEQFAFFDPATNPNTPPFRRFHVSNSGMTFTDISPPSEAAQSFYTISFSFPLPNGTSATVKWHMVPTNGGNTILVQGAATAESPAEQEPGLYGVSGVCQTM